MNTPGAQQVNSLKTNTTQSCDTYVITTYWEECDYAASDVTYSNPSNCAYYTTQGQPYTVCNSNPGGGGSSPSVPPCAVSSPPANPSAAQTSVKTHIIVNTVQPTPTPVTGTPGGNTGGIVDQTNDIGTAKCPDGTTSAPDTVATVFCNGLTKAQQASIRSTLNTFKSEDCVSKFLYSYFGGKAFSFCISPGQYNVAFSPQNNSFTFSSDEAATPVFASLLEHEFFHAYQNSVYGGISAYGKNAGTQVNSAGFVNIEFEQAVFNDIVTGNSTAFDGGTSDQTKNYTKWITSITNGGTAYPKTNPSSSDYNDFINKYNSFLQQYNQIPNNPNSSTIINLIPKAFIALFNSTTPNC